MIIAWTLFVIGCVLTLFALILTIGEFVQDDTDAAAKSFWVLVFCTIFTSIPAQAIFGS